MDDKLKRIEDKLDVVVEKVNDINIILAKQHVTLEEHMKRTAAAEENLDLLRKDFKPIQEHVSMVQGAIKFIGLLGVLAAIIECIALIGK